VIIRRLKPSFALAPDEQAQLRSLADSPHSTVCSRGACQIRVVVSGKAKQHPDRQMAAGLSRAPSQEVPLLFLRYQEQCVRPQFDLHLIVNNYATHKHPKVRSWLAQRGATLGSVRNAR